MADKTIYVFIELNGENHLVGRLWPHFNKGKESASFEYDDSWLSRKDKFSLEPVLKVSHGVYHTTGNKKIFGSLADSSPDRWGRVLMRRFENVKAREDGREPRTLNEIDYLLLVNDEARQGALRFKEDIGGEFLFPASIKSIPPLVNLPQLLHAAENVSEDKESNDDLRLLLAPGSSLGGARPKASVIDLKGNLCIAKFPKKDDNNNVVLWEAVALELAHKAGINTPIWHLENIQGKAVIVIKRFDRNGKSRIPFLSAMSMLDAADNDWTNYSYMDIADILRINGAAPSEDMRELWRRIVFSILISNTDDHLRNHGFLYAGEKGWRLSPVYDVNPTNNNTGVLHTNINENDNTASIDLAMSVAEYFDLKKDEATRIVQEVSSAVSSWESVAARLKISSPEINRMRVAFKQI